MVLRELAPSGEAHYPWMFCIATTEEAVAHCRLSFNSCCCKRGTKKVISYLGGVDAISLREELDSWHSSCGGVLYEAITDHCG